MDFTTFHNIVNGEKRTAGECYYGTNPVTKQKFTHHAPIATKANLNDAIQAAQNAFPAWSQTTFDERRRMLRAFAAKFSSYETDFASLLAEENGKPIIIAGGEIESAAQFLNYTADLTLTEERCKENDETIIVRHVPLGVVGALCPWNLPLLLSAGKIGPALMAGNCIIVKPSPFSPYSTLKLVELGQGIFPPGVLQVLGGNESLGPWMVEHEGIHKISFTGSVATGKKIMQSGAKTLKRLTLELGGNDACVVCADVDIPKVAAGVAFGSFFNTGQTYHHRAVLWLNGFTFTTTYIKLKVRKSHEENVMIGPLQNIMQYEKVKDLVNDCSSKGYKFALGGVVKLSDGYFISPCIIDNPPDDSRIVTEEAFGPIVPVQPWTSEQEVIKKVNDTSTGLGGSVWSKDLSKAESMARQIQAGTVWVNAIALVSPKAVFSGHKESGLGSEFGKHALESFCNTKSLVIHE